MSRTQAKLLITKTEAEAYVREAERFGTPVSAWALQVLRQAAGLPSMNPPPAKVARVHISSDETMTQQFKIRLNEEENDATIEAAGDQPWSAWVRTVLRAAANVR